MLVASKANLTGVRGADRLSIHRLRRQLPLPVFVLVLILLMVMLGFVCICMSDHPTRAADQALSALAHAPAIVEMWAFAILLIAPFFLEPAVGTFSAFGRASPARLQRFRF